MPRGPMCVWHDWDGCRFYLVDREKKRDRKVWRALGTLSLYQPIVTLLHLLHHPLSHGTVLVMVGRIRMAPGMDVDVAAGVEIPRTYVLRDVQNGSSEMWC